jgi:hypothetical protein
MNAQWSLRRSVLVLGVSGLFVTGAYAQAPVTGPAASGLVYGKSPAGQGAFFTSERSASGLSEKHVRSKDR